VLDMPTAEKASGTSEAEARQIITAQSKDFNEFRRRLAEGAPAAAAPSASRKASGSVQANVEERKPTATAPDKLTLSKGAVGAAGGTSAAKGSMNEEAIAKDKAAKDAAARTAELSKNIQELSKLGTPTVATAKPSAPAASAATPGIAVATGSNSTPAATSTAASTPTAATPTAAVTPVPATSTVAATTATSPSATATIAAAPVEPEPPKPAVKAPPAPEPSMVDSLLDNPITLPAAGGLLALLAGFGVYRMRQRKKSSQVDSSFLESRLQPDSFFGASGGQRVDTNDAPNSASASSMVYSPSQLDAAGDVDPVAEADVYLAYGRDLQAEEILKEAMRTNPSRVAIHAKLMEIYAKRRDTKAFETVANEVYAVTKGQGSDWDTAAALGREIDPANPLYQPVGVPMGSAGAGAGLGVGTMAAAAAAVGMGTAAFATKPSPQASMSAADPDVDFDLDLDFSSGDDLVEAPQVAPTHVSTSPIHVQQTAGLMAQPAAQPRVDLAFDAPDLPTLIPGSAMAMSAPDMDSFAKGLDFTAPTAARAPGTTTAPMAISANQAAPSMNAMEFDLGDLSLDLPKASAAASLDGSDPDISGDPLETKLALAQEFREIGDNDGARSLAQEVVTEATGALKARAQRLVADLS
jgi:pilus assembly protein FimV